MRYLSVCSGVEAASVAWEHLGWTPVGFSEIEPFPSAVLKYRFPNVPNFGDMTKYKEWPIEPNTVDVLVGGTPCQSFSVAGLRKGLDDPRGSLMLTFLGLAEHLRVPWLVWENVPGVLSSNGGRDFGSFLGALGQLGFRWAYRVLDAQHFGVPQRRRRVFVVAHLGDGPHPASVLFEPESLRGDSAKGGKARKGSPRGTRPGAESGGRFFDQQRIGQYSESAVTSTCAARDYKDAKDLVVTQLPIGLDEEQNAVVDGFGTLKARMLGGGFEGTVAVSPTIAFHPTQDPIHSVEVTHAKTRPTDGSEGGTGSRQGTATVAVATVTGTLSSRSSAAGGLGTDFEVAGGLQPTPTMAVRRLLPIETEFLQGFPANWTLIPWKGKPASECPDGPRYKAMGNSFAVPVVRWIGERLDRVVRGDL